MSPRGPCTFRQRDLTAAVKAIRDAGEKVRRVDVDKNGRITLTIGEPDDSSGSETAEDVRNLV